MEHELLASFFMFIFNEFTFTKITIKYQLVIIIYKTVTLVDILLHMITKIKNKSYKEGPFYASGILGKLSRHSNRTLTFFSSDLKRLRFVLTEEIQSFGHSIKIQVQNNSYYLLLLCLSVCIYKVYRNRD